jgi:hypothetical protein
MYRVFSRLYCAHRLWQIDCFLKESALSEASRQTTSRALYLTGQFHLRLDLLPKKLSPKHSVPLVDCDGTTVK